MNLALILVAGILWVRFRTDNFGLGPLGAFLGVAILTYAVVSILGNRVLKQVMTHRHPVDAALWQTVAMSSGRRAAEAALSADAKSDRVLAVVVLLLSFGRVAIPIVLGAIVSLLAT